jgi:hypothetical protein
VTEEGLGRFDAFPLHHNATRKIMPEIMKFQICDTGCFDQTPPRPSEIGRIQS